MIEKTRKKLIAAFQPKDDMTAVFYEEDSLNSLDGLFRSKVFCVNVYEERIYNNREEYDKDEPDEDCVVTNYEFVDESWHPYDGFCNVLEYANFIGFEYRDERKSWLEEKEKMKKENNRSKPNGTTPLR